MSRSPLELPSALKKAPTAGEAEAAKSLILVAEDNRTNQVVIRMQLNNLGYAAEIVSDGLKALQAWRTGRYSILLSDIHMPEMDGLDLVAAIRKEEQDKGEHLPVIAITANAMHGESQRCLNAGMDDYLSKPLEMEKLAEMLEKWMPQVVHQKDQGKNSPEQQEENETGMSTPGEPENMNDVAPADISLVTEIFAGDVEKIQTFLDHFTGSAKTYVEEIHKAFSEKSARRIGEWAHKLKSPAGYVGAKALAGLCEELEKAGYEENWDEIPAGISRLDGLLNEVITHIENIDLGSGSGTGETTG